MIENLINSLWQVISNIRIIFYDFSNWVLTVLSFVRDIFKTLRFWLTTLLSWIFEIFWEVFDSISWLVFSWFNSVGALIWWPGVVLIWTIFWIILVRISIAFVFKILRLNIDYRATRDKFDRMNSKLGKK